MPELPPNSAPAPPPEGEAEAPAKKKRDCLTGCAMVALGSLALFGLFGGCWAHQVGKARRQFAAEVRVRLEQRCAERPAPPEEENAAPLYRAAFVLFVRHPASDFYRSSALGPLSAEGRSFVSEDVVKHLADNAPYLAALRAAAARRTCDFEFDLGRGVRLDSSPGYRLRDAVSFLHAAARHAAQSGRPGEALELLALGLRLARDAGCEGVAFTRQTGCESATAAILQAVLNEPIFLDGEPGAAELDRALAALSGHLAARTPLVEAFRTMELLSLVTLADLNAGRTAEVFGYRDLGRDAVLGAWVQSGLGLKDARRAQRLAAEALAGCELPYPQRIEREMAVQSRVDDPPFWAIGSRMGSWALRPGYAARNDATALAELQAARLGLGCRLHRARFGRWPAALADLQDKLPEHFKELPVDPFSGKSFNYAPTKAGCKIYSVGRDRVDNGGLVFDPNTMSSSSPQDLVFELKR